ncbi:GAF domain-containing protein [Streptomyces sp. NPDC050560]|uniref:GAF domain-containing protein n=1 Tax=Streptomyces sp. NPDC050560 TaxID=3365630 RepID=UPI0037898CAF
MSFDLPGRLLLTPVDKDAPARVRRLRGLGIGGRPEPAFDAYAHHLAGLLGAPYAMVTFVAEDDQYFAGLHTPMETRPGAHGGLDRRLCRDHGYCPHVVVRRTALVLDDVTDFPRFAGNPLVDLIGMRSYLGAPLIDHTGMALGALCALDVGPRRWGPAGLATVKTLAAELAERVNRLEHGAP